jgi:predicted house-cleaning noncanonical NTP pyrophosphatase (MazG superfamily)
MKYDKLVRDRIPEILEQEGKHYTARMVENKEYEKYLIKKMQEETKEFQETPCLDEAADMYEVFKKILTQWDLRMTDVELVAHHKKELKGAFEYGIILEEVNEIGDIDQ